jgi:Flp pilus assembly protein TadD
MKLATAAPFLLLLVPAPAFARPCDEGQLTFVESAIIGDRLIQAENMISALRRDCAANVHFNALAARLALRQGRAAEANGLYQALAAQAPDNAEYAAGLGESALQLGQDEQALAALTRAAAAPGADWRTWNALGIVRDRRREWQAAGEAYAHAAELAPYEATVWSNRGYSLMLQHRPTDALILLDRAISLDPNNATIRRTREIAQAMTGVYDETRHANETNAAWAQRLNNIGYAAWLAGDATAARRLLSRAIEVSETRFERAEHNLARVEGRE